MRNDEIYSLLEKQAENHDLKLESREKTMRYGFKGLRVYVDAGFDAIEKADLIRNGRIGRNEEEIQDTRKRTVVVRYLHERPAVFAFCIFALLIGMSFIATRIKPAESIEKVIPIEIKK